MSTEEVNITVDPEEYRNLPPVNLYEVLADLKSSGVGHPGIETVPEELHQLARDIRDREAQPEATPLEKERRKLRDLLALYGFSGGYAWGDVAVLTPHRYVKGRGAIPVAADMKIV